MRMYSADDDKLLLVVRIIDSVSCDIYIDNGDDFLLVDMREFLISFEGLNWK